MLVVPSNQPNILRFMNNLKRCMFHKWNYGITHTVLRTKF